MDDDLRAGLRDRVRRLLAEHDPPDDAAAGLPATRGSTPDWRGCTSPRVCGGLGLPRALQAVRRRHARRRRRTDDRPSDGSASASAWRRRRSSRTAPTSSGRRFLRPLWTGEEVWCQLFSEPGAGSDLAGLATRAVRDGDDWVVNGQKVWTSSAHTSPTARSWSPAPTRTCPSTRASPTSCSTCATPGVEVRPLRQITGEAEFNEVFLTDVADPRHAPGRRRRRRLAGRQRHAHERAGLHRRQRDAPRGRHDRRGRAQPGASTPSTAPPSCTSGCCGCGSRPRSPGSPASGSARSSPPARPAPKGPAMKLTFARSPRSSPASRSSSSARRVCATTTGRCPAAGARSTSPAATPATATCAPRATPSRAARRRSSATSSPNGCWACPRARVDKDIAWKDLPR